MFHWFYVTQSGEMEVIMNIWELTGTFNIYDEFSIPDESSLETIYNIHIGQSLLHSWKPINISVCKDRRIKNTKLTLCDCPLFLTHLPLMNEKALNILMPLINKSIEILPVNVPEITDPAYNYSMINVLEVIDCVDWDNTEVELLPITNDLFEVLKFSLKEETVKNRHIFHLYERNKSIDYPAHKIYVSDKFRNIVLNNNLTGLDFIKIWSSEE